MNRRYRNKKILKLVLSLIALLVLIIIAVLFLLHNPKDKKTVKYIEDLLEIKIDRYVESGKGTIKKKNDSEYVNLKFEVKGYEVDKFKRELDGKMNFYELNSDVYLNKYVAKAKKYADGMNIDSFYQLSVDDRDIMGILCETNGQYYFLMIG